MRALIQRVKYARVSVDAQTTAQIDQGLVILLGVGHGDDESQAAFLAEKIVNLRIRLENTREKTGLKRTRMF